MSDLDVKKFVEEQVKAVKEVLGDEKALIAVSGGVDSTVSAVITHRAIGDNLACVFIDDNFMRLGEPERVKEMLSSPPLDLPVSILLERERFMKALEGLSDAEEKRIAFRETFYQTLGDAAKAEGCRFMVQGTIKADIDETTGGIYVASKTPGHKVLERIFVDPDHHRQGIGTRAMELAMEAYPEALLWTLGTPEWNARTTAFYENLGFVQIGWDLSIPEWRGRWYEKTVDPSQPYEMTPIGDLKDGMKDTDVEGEILEKGIARQVRSKRRRWQTLAVANTGFGDDSGRIVLVLWNEQIKQVKVGDRLRIENGYVSSYQDIKQLNVGRAGRLIHLI